MENCIFCMIAKGQLESKKVYETDEVLAFDDIAPQAPVHTLIIPKEHFGSMQDPGLSSDAVAAVFSAVPEVARLKGIDVDGYRIIVNNGRNANQTVGHLHVHVMGGREMSHGMVNFEE